MRQADEGSEDEKRERYRELLEELRVVLPGVQVLFAFLLTAPFSSRFSELDGTGRAGYFVALTSAAVSAVMFLTPTSYHRIAGREDRTRRLRIGVALTVAGMAALIVAMVAALFVVTRFVFGPDEGYLVAAVVAGTAAVLWYLLPSGHRLRRGDGDESSSGRSGPG